MAIVESLHDNLVRHLTDALGHSSAPPGSNLVWTVLSADNRAPVSVVLVTANDGPTVSIFAPFDGAEGVKHHKVRHKDEVPAIIAEIHAKAGRGAGVPGKGLRTP